MGRPRKVTMELARRFAEEMKADIAHSVESASYAVGLNPNSVRDCINRYERGECDTEEDEEVCEVLAAAKSEHVRELRRKGHIASEDANGPGVAWFKWRLETGAPKEHPRKTESAVELSGPGGSPMQHEYRQLLPRADAIAELRKLAAEDPEIAEALKLGDGE
jgi:hypothetical protein